MNGRAIWAVAKKDMRGIAANVQVWMPMLVVPMLLGIVLPLAGVLVLANAPLDMSNSDAQQIVNWLKNLPPSALMQRLEQMPSINHQMVYMLTNYMMAPLFLLIPLMTSSVISADSFAGEKERGTLESLLFTPTDLLSLLVGKVLAAFLPAVGLSLATFLLCAVSINGAGWTLFGGPFFPNWNWLPLMLLLIPMVSLIAILFSVYISSRVSSFQAAYQLGALVVLPMIALLLGQVTGALLLDTLVITLIGLALALLNVAGIVLIVRKLDRNALFASQIR